MLPRGSKDDFLKGLRLASEIWQFAAFLGVVVVAFVLWLNIIYLPGRTLEQRYDGGDGLFGSSPDNSRVPANNDVSQSSSDPTR